MEGRYARAQTHGTNTLTPQKDADTGRSRNPARLLPARRARYNIRHITLPTTGGCTMRCCFPLLLALLFTVPARADEKVKPGIEKSSYGKTEDGTEVDLYTLTNANGMKAKIITYGGIITELWVPDKN